MPSHQALSTGIINRRRSGRPDEPLPGHTLVEMMEEAMRRYLQQLEVLAKSGCVQCGDPPVAIVYPPDIEFQMVEAGRRPFEEATRAVEIRVRVRMLCQVHLNLEGPQ